MHKFQPAANTKGGFVMIGNTGNHYSGGALDGALADIEVYDSKLVDNHVISAHLRYLCNFYDIKDTIYT